MSFFFVNNNPTADSKIILYHIIYTKKIYESPINQN